jgi:hypothetical protein
MNLASGWGVEEVLTVFFTTLAGFDVELIWDPHFYK